MTSSSVFIQLTLLATEGYPVLVLQIPRWLGGRSLVRDCVISSVCDLPVLAVDESLSRATVDICGL